MQTIKQQTFCGREFTDKEISLIQEVVGCVQFSSPAWRMRARDSR